VARSAVSVEEIQLRKRARRRLVGAIALAVLVIAALPMFLDGEPQQRLQHIDVRIPPQPKLPPDEWTPAPPPVSQASPTQPPSAADAARAPASNSPSAVAPAAPAKPDAARAGGEGAETYAVALIATTSPAKAAQMKRTLQRLKFPVYTQKTPDGDKTRVRVGPYANREAAEQARQRLARQGYDPGKVVRQGE
jgi:DedD protein